MRTISNRLRYSRGGAATVPSGGATFSEPARLPSDWRETVKELIAEALAELKPAPNVEVRLDADELAAKLADRLVIQVESAPPDPDSGAFDIIVERNSEGDAVRYRKIRRPS
jgi:hypothetical protein